MKIKSLYITPKVRIADVMLNDSFLAGSGSIESGGTDGKGGHGISAAKSSSFSDDSQPSWGTSW